MYLPQKFSKPDYSFSHSNQNSNPILAIISIVKIILIKNSAFNYNTSRKLHGFT